MLRAAGLIPLVAGYGRLVGCSCADTRCRCLPLAPGRDDEGGFRQSERRHIAVHGFVLACPDLISLVPDADITRLPDYPVELAPRLQMGQVLGPCEAIQCFEVLSIHHQDGCPPEPLVVTEAAQFGMIVQGLEHLRHR